MRLQAFVIRRFSTLSRTIRGSDLSTLKRQEPVYVPLWRWLNRRLNKLFPWQFYSNLFLFRSFSTVAPRYVNPDSYFEYMSPARVECF